MNTMTATSNTVPNGAISGMVGTALRQITAVICRQLKRWMCDPQPQSVLRNHTNLPVFLALALGISLLCNFALKESSAHASRFMSSTITLQEMQALVRQNPDDPLLHSRLGELHLQQHNYRRAMFHFREAGRLGELYWD